MGYIHKCDIDVAKVSKVIKNMLEDLQPVNIEEPLLLPLTTTTLEKVIDWCTFHRNDVETIQNSSDNVYDLADWDVQFLTLADSDIFDIIVAADFLHIENLINMACMTIAKGYTKGIIIQRFSVTHSMARILLIKYKKIYST